MARIVYVGLLFAGSSAAARADSLRRLGHEVTALEGGPREPGLSRLRGGLRRKLGLGPAHPLGAEMVRAVEANEAELLWVDKGLNVPARAIAEAKARRPGLGSVHYSLDDYRIPGNTSRDLLQSLPSYDLVVTTKSYNVDWLRRHGARHPLMSWQGFDADVHRPPGPSEGDPTLAGRIVLVGAWEPERAALVEALVGAGLPVTVLSAWRQWENVARRCPTLEWRRWEVYGRAYALALGSAAVALGVLRKAASDLHTQRSVEIPACGTVLLAERTSEHLALFREGEEAEFFGDVAECVDRSRALLNDPVRRGRIAGAGRLRCQRDGYAWTERVRQILSEVGIGSASPGGRISP